ncbi:MAG: peptidoglycan DD-metalloendopeptidase family protein [Elusimicrobiota bacterium]
MNKITVFIFLFFISGSVFPDDYDSMIKNYKRQIEKKSSDLTEIQKQIQSKKAEKDKYQKEEQQIRKELNRIERELSGVSSEIVRIKSKIRKTQKNLESAEKEISIAHMEKGQVQLILRKELSEAGKRRLTCALFDDLWDEPVRKYAIKSKTSRIMVVQTKKNTAESAKKEYIKIKEELNSLESQLIKKQEIQESIKKEKSTILATTQGSRIGAEEEIKRLNETGNELKNLIQKLEEKKAETLEMKRQEEIAQKEFSEKKRLLPWPVDGEVVIPFGKTKHPELETYVINNGVKIKTESGQTVLSVDKGEVVYAQEFRSYGKTVIIDHKGGAYTIYGNLGEILVDTGMKIAQGVALGKTGSSGKDLFYFEIRLNGQPQDPNEWLK